jgi:hypothetical protein
VSACSHKGSEPRGRNIDATLHDYGNFIFIGCANNYLLKGSGGKRKMLSRLFQDVGDLLLRIVSVYIAGWTDGWLLG